MAHILSFPSSRALAVRVQREVEDPGWLVLTHNREHGWLCGSFDSALLEASIVAASFDVVVVSSAGRIAPC
jgi:hypothetical protein